MSPILGMGMPSALEMWIFGVVGFLGVIVIGTLIVLGVVRLVRGKRNEGE